MSDGENWGILLSGVVIHSLPDNTPHLELDSSLCWDLDFLQSFRILCSSCCLFLDFKDTKVAKLQTVVLSKLCGYLIEELLHYFFGSNFLTLSPLRDSVDKLFFCYCCHQLILKSDFLDYLEEYK